MTGLHVNINQVAFAWELFFAFIVGFDLNLESKTDLLVRDRKLILKPSFNKLVPVETKIKFFYAFKSFPSVTRLSSPPRSQTSRWST